MRNHYDQRSAAGQWQARQAVLDELSQEIMAELDRRPLTPEREALHKAFNHHPKYCRCWQDERNFESY